MINKVMSHHITQFIFAIVGIFFFGSLPFLLYDFDRLLDIQLLLDSGKLKNTLFLHNPIAFHYEFFWKGILETIHGLVNISTTSYLTPRLSELPLYPTFFELYGKTIKYLGLSLIISFTVSIFLTYLIMLSHTRVKKGVKFFFFVIESLPDLFVVIGLQLFVIWFFKKTNILLFNIVNSFGSEAVVLPLLVLSFLPAVYMTRYLLLTFEDEYESLYVELARGKGLSSLSILIKHIFRNAFASFVFHFKTIFWFTLSNLLMVEIVLNVNGFLRFIWRNCVRNPELLTMGMIYIFVPFFIIMTALQYIAKRVSLKGVEE